MVIWPGLRAIQSFGCFQIMESKIYLGRHNKRKSAEAGVQDLSWTSEKRFNNLKAINRLLQTGKGWSPRFILDVTTNGKSVLTT